MPGPSSSKAFPSVATSSNTRRWHMLIFVAIFQFHIGFQYLNFGSIQSISACLYDVNVDEINWLYSVIMLSSIPVLFPAGYLFSRYPVLTYTLAVAAIVVGAWMRVLSAWDRNASLALASGVPMGISSAVWLTTLVPFAKSYFPLREQTLAITIMVQSSHFGLLCGGFLTPLLVTQADQLPQLLLLQAVMVLVEVMLLGAACCCGRYRNKVNHRSMEHGRKVESKPLSLPTAPVKSDVKMFFNMRFLTQLLAFGVLGGARYAISAIQDSMFARFGFACAETAWTQAVYVIVGVASGLVLGAVAKGKIYRVHLVLCITFVVGSLGLTCLAYVVNIEDTAFLDDPATRKWFFYLLLVLMAMIGGAGWGFQGLAMFSVAECTHPINSGYSVACVLFLQLFVAVGLTSGLPSSLAMVIVAVLMWGSTIALVAVFSRKPKDTPKWVTAVESGAVC